MRRLTILTLILFYSGIGMVGALTFSGSLNYLDGDTLGVIHFGDDFTADSVTWTATEIRFSNFQLDPHGFGNLGVSASNNTELNITQCNPQYTVIEPTTPVNVTCTGTVYAPSRLYVNNVTGVNTWAWDGSGKTVTFTTDTNSTITVNWGLPVYTPTAIHIVLIIFIILTLMMMRRR